jgi:sugar lactone lactonase YvrE
MIVVAVHALPAHGPSALYFNADPNGLALANGVLYVADAETGTIMRGDSTPLATIYGDETCDCVRGLAAAPDGSLYATTRHSVFRIMPDGSTIELDLPPEPVRFGVACRGRAVYATQYSNSITGPCDGKVVRIADGRVSTIACGLGKPVGLAWVADALLVVDAAQRGVFAIDGRRCVRALAALDARPDAICAYGASSALVTTYDDVERRGAVVRVWLDGSSREVATGDWEPSGIATDGELVFVSVRHGGRVLVLTI